MYSKRQVPYQIYDLQIFSLILWVFSPFDVRSLILRNSSCLFFFFFCFCFISKNPLFSKRSQRLTSLPPFNRVLQF